jgi:flavin-dependent dehydrogenase
VQAALPEAPGGDHAALLADIVRATPHIAPLIAEFETAVHLHRIAPAVRHPLVGDSWLAMGSAAMALDPICGDGTGQALRGGLLAAAVVTAAEEGGDRTTPVGHFERRLLRSFGAHLAACARFYQPALFGAHWQREIAAAQAAAAAFAPAAKAPLEFGLQNLRLVPVESERGEPLNAAPAPGREP